MSLIVMIVYFRFDCNHPFASFLRFFSITCKMQATNIIFDYFQPATDAGDEENYAVEGNDMLGKFTCQHSQTVEEIYEKTIVKIRILQTYYSYSMVICVDFCHSQ